MGIRQQGRQGGIAMDILWFLIIVILVLVLLRAL